MSEQHQSIVDNASEADARALLMTHAEWMAEAERRFGTDAKQWAFICPVCGGRQTIADFLALQDPPEHPENVVNFSCIGRYLPNAPEAFAMGRGASKLPRPTPETHCNYTLGGLFTLVGVIVEFEGKEISSFAFAPPRTESECFADGTVHTGESR